MPELSYGDISRVFVLGSLSFIYPCSTIHQQFSLASADEGARKVPAMICSAANEAARQSPATSESRDNVQASDVRHATALVACLEQFLLEPPIGPIKGHVSTTCLGPLLDQRDFLLVWEISRGKIAHWCVERPPGIAHWCSERIKVDEQIKFYAAESFENVNSAYSFAMINSRDGHIAAGLPPAETIAKTREATQAAEGGARGH